MKLVLELELEYFLFVVNISFNWFEVSLVEVPRLCGEGRKILRIVFQLLHCNFIRVGYREDK